jgi:hypothetical protein
VTNVLPTPTGQQTDLDQLHNDLARARQETAGPVPLIQNSLDPVIELPRGLMYNGTWHTQVTVRELTGVDEEVLARVKTVQDMFDNVITLGTVRIGALEMGQMPFPDRQGMLQSLLLGEREQLYLAVVQATYGDQKTLKYTCPACEETQDLILTISEDFKPRHVEEVDHTEFRYVTSKGVDIAYRPAIGADQIEALARKGASPAEQNTIILSRCIKTVDGQMVLNPLEYARAMAMRDRTALLDLLIERQPTVDLSITINCAVCREEQTISLGWGDLFRP